MICRTINFRIRFARVIFEIIWNEIFSQVRGISSYCCLLLRYCITENFPNFFFKECIAKFFFLDINSLAYRKTKKLKTTYEILNINDILIPAITFWQPSHKLSNSIKLSFTIFSNWFLDTIQDTFLWWINKIKLKQLTTQVSCLRWLTFSFKRLMFNAFTKLRHNFIT